MGGAEAEGSVDALFGAGLDAVAAGDAVEAADFFWDVEAHGAGFDTAFAVGAGVGVEDEGGE